MKPTCGRLSRRRAATTLVGLGLVFASGVGYTQIAAADTNTPVKIVDFDFGPGVLTANPGDTVTWTNTGSLVHNLTSDTSVWDASTLPSGATFSFHFTTPGTYSYRCTIHPEMHGLIFVPGAPGQQPAANDGRQFSSESASTQTFFTATFADQAALEWVREHDAGLPVQPGAPAPAAPAAPAPAPVPPQVVPVAPAPPPDAPAAPAPDDASPPGY